MELPDLKNLVSFLHEKAPRERFKIDFLYIWPYNLEHKQILGSIFQAKRTFSENLPFLFRFKSVFGHKVIKLRRFTPLQMLQVLLFYDLICNLRMQFLLIQLFLEHFIPKSWDNLMRSFITSQNMKLVSRGDLIILRCHIRLENLRAKRYWVEPKLLVH